MTTVRVQASLAETAAAPRSLSVVRALVPVATVVVIVALALLLVMTPVWVHFAMTASGGILALATPAEALLLSDRTVAELFVGPGTFSAFTADEAAHMRDVRVVLWAFLAIALAAAALLAWQVRGRRDDPRLWRSIARGGSALAVALAALGLFAAVAFGLAFELFHRILFPGGNWAFSPDSLLIRLYPYGFWQLSAAALGILGIGGGALVWLLARRRARSLAVAARS